MLLRKRFKISYVCVLILICWSIYYLFLSIPIVKRNSSLLKKPPPRLFIAANLYDNRAIVEHWASQVLKVANWAGPDRVYISIFENGSTDNTKPLLQAFDDLLTAANISHTIVLDPSPKIYERRIPLLAKRRNQALIPLYEQLRRHTTYDKILFLNDIWFDWTDAVELIESGKDDLGDQDSDNYDAVCSMDFFGQYYDEFATRETNGGWLGSGNYPYFQDKTSRALLRRQMLVPVYSCWGGMIVFNAAPFLMTNPTTQDPLVVFRALWPDNPRPRLEASECCLIHSDIRDLNFTRIFINPNIKVGYDHFHYWYANYILPLWQIFLSWTNTPVAISEEEKVLWDERLATVGPLNPGDSTCLWRPGHYD
ncbi:unnamed protein product [Absidia cylindrospora]